MRNKQIIVVSGPTAIGKTHLSLELAAYFDIPIISADSRQIFCKVDIGTAKPTNDQLNLVKHYFINHISVDEIYNVGQYELEVSALIEDLFKVYDQVLICGGTGLYIQSITEGLNALPASKPDVRKNIEDLYKQGGLSLLQNELLNKDPVYFAKVDLQNPRRIMRALEVYMSTGKRYSEFIIEDKVKTKYPVKEIYLSLDRELLYDRINKRVDQMIKEGLLEEAESLLSYRNCQALKTVGYQELFKYFDGEWTLDFAIDKIKQHTRNYAKRQMTWFNKFSKGRRFEIIDTNQILRFLES